MNKHTPTPWSNVGWEIRSPNSQPIASLFNIVSTNENRNVCAKANAEFIVEAVNNYESLRALNAELVEALEEALSVIRSYLDYDHSGDPWEEDARVMGEMDINEYRRDGRLEKAESTLANAKGARK